MTGWRERLLWVELVVIVAVQLVVVAPAFAREVPIVPAGRAFTCTAERLWDGDGPIWCREGFRVRLARINARELDNSCRPGAPCIGATGITAREHLAALLGGVRGRTADGHILLSPVRLACRSDGPARGDRTAAWCQRDGVDLSATMVRDGYAAPWKSPHPR